MKPENEIELLSIKSLFPIKVAMRPIKSIDYDFNPSSTWTSRAITYGDSNKTVEIIDGTDFISKHKKDGSKIESDIKILAKDRNEFESLISTARQIMRDYRYIEEKLPDIKDATLEIRLQLCALLITVAQRWEIFGVQMHDLLRRADMEMAENQLRYIFKRYVTPKYGVMGTLLKITKQTTLESDKHKVALRKMLNFVEGKIFASIMAHDSTYTKDVASAFIGYKRYVQEENNSLIERGFGYLIPEHKLEPFKEEVPEPSTSSVLFEGATSTSSILFEGAKGLFSSALSSAYNMAFGSKSSSSTAKNNHADPTEETPLTTKKIQKND